MSTHSDIELELKAASARGFGNKLVTRLLRSSMHGLLSASVCLISYDGHHSGRRYLTPVQYAPWGNSILILVGRPERKAWWRNMATEDGYPVDVMIERQWTTTAARSYLGADHREFVNKMCDAYVARFPRTAKTLNTTSAQARESIRFVLCTPPTPNRDGPH